MGKESKNKVNGAMSGAAMGSAFGPLGTGIGAGVGLLAGDLFGTGGDAPEHVPVVDPTFVNTLYNQAMGTEKTAADAKMKASFDKTLAQQVAAARAARGVNPALLQRNVARQAQETNAKAAELGEEMNLRAQDDARARYLQAIGMNQNAQLNNTRLNMAAEERDDKRAGAMLNNLGAIGATFATMPKASPNASNELPGVPAGDDTLQRSMAVDPNAYSLGANTTATSDQRVKTDIKKIMAKVPKKNVNKKSDLVVVSDERQKDLIKAETLPQNGTLNQQNQQAVQPQGASMQTPMIAAQTAPTSTTSATSTQTAPQAPAPVPASQTALAQANSSLAKGGRIDDLQLQDTSMIQKPEDAPSQDTLNFFASEAKRQQRRDMWGNPVESDRQIYNRLLAGWQANQARNRESYMKQMDDAKLANANINNERSARLAKFYTGTTNVNANDLANRYISKTVAPDMSWNTVKALVPENSGQQYNYGPAINAYAGRALTLSDERSKDGVSKADGDTSMSPKSFLDKLTAYSYEYKQSAKNKADAGPGRHLSVMAQDLEQAGPVGQSMVETGPDGMKKVDYGKGFGAILAAQVELNERLKQIEAKGGKNGK